MDVTMMLAAANSTPGIFNTCNRLAEKFKKYPIFFFIVKRLIKMISKMKKTTEKKQLYIIFKTEYSRAMKV